MQQTMDRAMICARDTDVLQAGGVSVPLPVRAAPGRWWTEVMSTDARELHGDAVVADTHNDLILLVDHFDQRQQPTHFADFWLPELRAGGVDVQVLPICLEEQFQSEGGLRRTLLLIERIHELAAEHAADVALCLTGEDVDAATADGKIALI